MAHITEHAQRRCAQRRISPEHIKLALAWGRAIRQRGGRTAYHLGFREAERAARAGVQVPPRAIGVAVVVFDEETIVTSVRSPDRKRLQTKGHRHRPPYGRGTR